MNSPITQSLLEFLVTLRNSGFLATDKNPGLVVYADDQTICQRQLKNNFKAIGFTEKLFIFPDGQQVVEYIDFLFEDIDLSGEEQI